ncbi:hypothetical protein [Thermolongibacillus altinsuensis]|uniref:hypothetical protein n=1 Tax=Thermolongibacillus altinsuensis TaxID=575256 RepID=UPI00242A2C1F|nr:hypothetical protein [Thermolongibacillus altinsuensis]GMB07839.1 hypothetical protein B1no1_05490 [Thermolongibacillus altinsuensis]
MLLLFFCLIVGFVSGYLMIAWTPLTVPFVFGTFITELIFNPLKTFLALVCFLIGFVANALLIRSAIRQTICLWKRKGVRIGELVFSYSAFASFYALSTMNAEKTFVFFLFSLIYGMMTMDIFIERKR